MADENKMEKGLQVYDRICKALDNRGWHYKGDEEELAISFGVQGDDLSMDFRIKVQAEKQFVFLTSMMPYTIPDDKRVEIAIATCMVNVILVSGNFDFDLRKGKIAFRVSQSYMDSDIDEDAFEKMVSIACGTIDTFNEKFLGVGTGMLELDRFLEQLND